MITDTNTKIQSFFTLPYPPSVVEYLTLTRDGALICIENLTVYKESCDSSTSRGAFKALSIRINNKL